MQGGGALFSPLDPLCQRKENNLAPRRGLFSVAPCKTIQLGSQYRIVQLGSLRMFGAWHPRGLSSLASPTTSRASSPSSRTKHNSFPVGSFSAIFDAQPEKSCVSEIDESFLFRPCGFAKYFSVINSRWLPPCNCQSSSSSDLLTCIE